MKNPRVLFRILTLLAAVFLCASLPRSHAGDLDIATPEDVLTAGPWKVSYEKGWFVVRFFDKGGTFSTPGRPDETGRWRISGNMVVQTFADGRKDIFTLPLNVQGTIGVARDGETLTAVRQIGMPAPAATPATEMGEIEKGAATDVLLSGPWKFSVGTWSTVRIFDKNGVFSTPSSLQEHGRWKIADGMVTLAFADGHKDYLILPLNAKSTLCSLEDGEAGTALVTAPAPAESAQPIPTPPAIAGPTPTPRSTTMSEEDRVAATAVLLSGPWKISGGGWSAIRVFGKDGTFTSPGAPASSGHWKISNNIVTLTFADGHKDTLLLPLDPKQTAGTDQYGGPTTAMLVNAAAGNTTPAPAPAPTPALSRPASTPQPAATAAQGGDATVALLTSGPWRISTKLRSDVRLFMKDGTFTTVNKPGDKGRWSMTSDLIILIFPSGHKDAMMLPLNPRGTDGMADDGNALTAVLLDTAAAPPGSPLATPATSSVPFGSAGHD